MNSSVRTETVSERQPASVAPVLPLAILESMRAHDRPSEILEDEDLTVSLPRRLGLASVIDAQIQRYRQALRRGKPVPAREVIDLVRLVLRRPDAEAILREAGHQIVQRDFGDLSSVARIALRILPASASLAAIRRTARKALRRLLGGGTVEFTTRPFAARISGAFTTELDSSGTTCLVYAGVLEEVLSRYSGQQRSLPHPRCTARGDAFCEWILSES